MSQQEWRLVRARRRATRLAVALVREPFAAATVEALRSYLEEDAEAAQASYAELTQQPTQALRARIDQLLADGHTPRPYQSRGVR
ncbi:hypothetical protein ACWGCW_25900 [Streptomyces sp. NPDC054933]